MDEDKLKLSEVSRDELELLGVRWDVGRGVS